MAKLLGYQANQVWDLLEAEYGAGSDPWTRRSFVDYLTRGDTSGHEFRFMGIFGPGGKLRLNNYDGLYVTYYPESETPERKAKAAILNAQLQGMWFRFREWNEATASSFA